LSSDLHHRKFNTIRTAAHPHVDQLDVDAPFAEMCVTTGCPQSLLLLPIAGVIDMYGRFYKEDLNLVNEVYNFNADNTINDFNAMYHRVHHAENQAEITTIILTTFNATVLPPDLYKYDATSQNPMALRNLLYAVAILMRHYHALAALANKQAQANQFSWFSWCNLNAQELYGKADEGIIGIAKSFNNWEKVNFFKRV